MEKNKSGRIVSILEEFVSEHKQRLIKQVLQARTRHVTFVFEDIDKPHNISAVVRTTECLGIQDIHFIENNNKYAINRHIVQGAAKWVTLHHYREKDNNIDGCYDQLRKSGYKIYATSLDETSRTIQELSNEEKIAIVFGTEAGGISEEAGEKADGFVCVPISGFTESLNLSVSAAICLNTLLNKHNGSFPILIKREQLYLKTDWYRKIVREADMILRSKGLTI